MKKIIIAFTALISIGATAQNTIPTTTVTGALKINDSLRVNRTITAKGEVIVKDTLRAKKDVLVDGNVNINGKLKVQGNVRFKDDARFDKGFTFDGTYGMSMTQATATSPKIFRYGNTQVNSVLPINCVAGPQAWANHQFGGMMQIFDGVNPGTTALLNIQNFGTKSYIDASDGGNTGSMVYY